MRKLLATIILAVAAVASCSSVYARAGGGVSVGRSSSPVSRPSYSAPKSPPRYVAPAQAAPSVAPSVAPVVQPSSGFGSSFLGGLAGGAVGSVVGNAISHPSGYPAGHSGGTTVVNSGSGGYAQGAVAGMPGGTVVVNQSSSAWGWFVFLLFIIVGGFFAWKVYMYLTNKNKEEECTQADFDAVSFFYEVQQAAMDDNVAALRKLCTKGIATVLSGFPEEGRVAVKTLTGLTYSIDEYTGDIFYHFTDTVEGVKVAESWQMSNDGKLEGITVM